MGNFIDPKMLGRRLSLSPLVLLFSARLLGITFWGIPVGAPARGGPDDGAADGPCWPAVSGDGAFRAPAQR